MSGTRVQAAVSRSPAAATPSGIRTGVTAWAGIVVSVVAAALVLAWPGIGIRGLAFVRIKLLLDHSLRPRLLSSRLMLRLKLDFTEVTDSDHRNVLDSLYDPQIALGHAYSLPQIPRVRRY